MPQVAVSRHKIATLTLNLYFYCNSNDIIYRIRKRVKDFFTPSHLSYEAIRRKNKIKSISPFTTFIKAFINVVKGLIDWILFLRRMAVWPHNLSSIIAIESVGNLVIL